MACAEKLPAMFFAFDDSILTANVQGIEKNLRARIEADAMFLPIVSVLRTCLSRIAESLLPIHFRPLRKSLDRASSFDEICESEIVFREDGSSRTTGAKPFAIAVFVLERLCSPNFGKCR